MPTTYSTYEAKARFSEVLRKVRAGETVFISYRGATVAEIRPHEPATTVEQRFERLEAAGRLTAAAAGDEPARLEPVARRPGALERFLESRE